jgi:hypothetical protein
MSSSPSKRGPSAGLDPETAATLRKDLVRWLARRAGNADLADDLVQDGRWEEPTLARFLGRIRMFRRLLCFDKRGTGVADPVPLAALPWRTTG